jgi:hypothetical protein
MIDELNDIRVNCLAIPPVNLDISVLSPITSCDPKLPAKYTFESLDNIAELYTTAEGVVIDFAIALSSIVAYLGVGMFPTGDGTPS